jgi:hypothetical protein
MSNNAGGTLLDSIDCSAQPLDLSFHPSKENVLVAALADGTIESEFMFAHYSDIWVMANLTNRLPLAMHNTYVCLYIYSPRHSSTE